MINHQSIINQLSINQSSINPSFETYYPPVSLRRSPQEAVLQAAQVPPALGAPQSCQSCHQPSSRPSIRHQAKPPTCTKEAPCSYSLPSPVTISQRLRRDFRLQKDSNLESEDESSSPQPPAQPRTLTPCSPSPSTESLREASPLSFPLSLSQCSQAGRI